MEIAIFWLDKNDQPCVSMLQKDELTSALSISKQLRDDGHRHVTISTEFDNSVGKKGVTDAEKGYDWKKRRI